MLIYAGYLILEGIVKLSKVLSGPILEITIILVAIIILLGAVGMKISTNLGATALKVLVKALGGVTKTLARALGWVAREIYKVTPKIFRWFRNRFLAWGLRPKLATFFAFVITGLLLAVII